MASIERRAGIHATRLELIEPARREVVAGDVFLVPIAITCSEGCGLGGGALEISGTIPAAPEFPISWEGPPEGESDRSAVAVARLRAPARVGDAQWILTFPEQLVGRAVHQRATLDVQATILPHGTSIAVWDVPSPFVGERFAVRVGVKCARGCALGGRRVQVLGEDGEILGRAELDEHPQAGTVALHGGIVQLVAPDEPGVVRRTMVLEGESTPMPHAGATTRFTFRALQPPEHTVLVHVVPAGLDAPLDRVDVRLGPYQGETDARGEARVGVPKGTYDLSADRVDIEPVVQRVEVTGDTRVEVAIEPRRIENDDNDVWM